MELFYGFFNILMGTLMLLISFGKIKLEKVLNERWIFFFKIGGIGMIFWGILKIYLWF